MMKAVADYYTSLRAEEPRAPTSLLDYLLATGEEE